MNDLIMKCQLHMLHHNFSFESITESNYHEQYDFVIVGSGPGKML